MTAADLYEYHQQAAESAPPVEDALLVTTFAFVVWLLKLGEPRAAWKVYNETMTGLPGPRPPDVSGSTGGIARQHVLISTRLVMPRPARPLTRAAVQQ